MRYGVKTPVGHGREQGSGYRNSGVHLRGSRSHSTGTVKPSICWLGYGVHLGGSRCQGTETQRREGAAKEGGSKCKGTENLSLVP